MNTSTTAQFGADQRTSPDITSDPQYIVEGIILRRLHEKRIEGYTIDTAKEIVAAMNAVAATPTETTSIVQRLRNFAVWNNRHSHYEPVPLCKEAADLIERISAPAQSAWQPIETAPKDGTSVLVVHDETIVSEAAFDIQDDNWWLAQTGPHDFDPSRAVYPTLWMPMPAPPVSSTHSEAGK